MDAYFDSAIIVKLCVKEFVTFDGRQGALAKRIGLTVKQ